MWFTNPMKMFTQEKRKLYIHKDWYAIFMPWLLAAKIQKKHECPSVGVMVGAVKSKITWEAGAIFIVWVNVGRSARRNGWHHSLTGDPVLSKWERELSASVCSPLSAAWLWGLWSNGTSCSNLLLPWLLHQGGQHPCPVSLTKPSPFSFFCQSVFSQRWEWNQDSRPRNKQIQIETHDGMLSRKPLVP